MANFKQHLATSSITINTEIHPKGVFHINSELWISSRKTEDPEIHAVKSLLAKLQFNFPVFLHPKNSRKYLQWAEFNFDIQNLHRAQLQQITLSILFRIFFHYRFDSWFVIIGLQKPPTIIRTNLISQQWNLRGLEILLASL